MCNPWLNLTKSVIIVICKISKWAGFKDRTGYLFAGMSTFNHFEQLWNGKHHNSKKIQGVWHKIGCPETSGCFCFKSPMIQFVRLKIYICAKLLSSFFVRMLSLFSYVASLCLTWVVRLSVCPSLVKKSRIRHCGLVIAICLIIILASVLILICS